MQRLSFLACLGVLAMTAAVFAADDKVLSGTMKDIDGKDVDLAKKYDGKVVLVVNVASKCGLTPQYAALEALHRRFNDRGFQRARRAVQPVRRAGAGLGRGDRCVLLRHLWRQLPADREGRGQRRHAPPAL